LFDAIIFASIVPLIGFGVFLLIASLFIPVTTIQYKVPVIVVGFLLVAFGLFEAGRHTEILKSEEAAKDFQIKIAHQQEQLQEATKDIVVKYITDTKVVEKIKEVPVHDFIPKEADVSCGDIDRIAPNFRLLLDDASQGRATSAAQRADGSASDPK
jgi:hypothetical protein